MIRPQPPLSALHFFAPENDEEKRLRHEMGFTTPGDADEPEEGDTEVDGSNQHVEPVLPPSLPRTTSLHVTNDSRQEVPHFTLGREERDKAEAPMRVDSTPIADKVDVSAPSVGVPTLPSVIPQPAEPPVGEDMGRGTVPFMSTPAAPLLDKGKAKEVVPETRRREASDSPIPELDSGSSDFNFADSDDEEEADEAG